MLRPFALVALLALAGCGVLGIGGSEAPRTVADVPRERTVDPAEAARLINAWRAKRGRPALVVDSTLTAIAADTARKLAKRDTMNTEMHTASGLERRLAGKFDASRAAENLGAGYPTLVGTVEGWKKSRHHNDNLLNADLTHMGIGLALTDKGAFHSYWVLILAKPAERHALPDAGPPVGGPPVGGPPVAGALIGVPMDVPAGAPPTL